VRVLLSSYYSIVKVGVGLGVGVLVGVGLGVGVAFTFSIFIFYLTCVNVAITDGMTGILPDAASY
jgi:uncharacterized oligopeptide transporter (OPT) family protein